MPGPKPKVKNSLEVMKADEGNDSLDTFIRQAIGKEPLISFSRAGDSPVQWIQLLHALDQQDLPGWPLLTPLKVQMQKCEKCSREFCSSINYRRHIRVQHRLRKLDKDSSINRDELGAFWDKLSEDDAKEILSFKDVSLQEVSGSSILKSLTALIRKPGFSTLPQYCLRAGSVLLEIIQARPPKFPLSSDELFSILDDASEKTFLCRSAESVQKYIFDGEVGKIGLETKNLVACTSFLVEQKLVEACLADKNAEALRRQELLMEEEEAAQIRQAKHLERKRQRKLRQKEQKAKEQRPGEEDVKGRIDETLDVVPLAEQPCTFVESDSDAHRPEASSDYLSSLEPIWLPNVAGDVDVEIENSDGYADPGSGNYVQQRMVQVNSRKRVVARWHMPPKSHSNHLPNGFHSNQSYQTPKFSNQRKHGPQWELKPVPVANNNRKWSRWKYEAETSEESSKAGQKESVSQPDSNKKREVLIGTIPVSLGNCKQPEGNDLDGAHDHCLMEHQMAQDMVQEKHDRPNSALGGTGQSTVKLWRPVSQNGKGPTIVENSNRECHVDVLSKAEDPFPSGACGLESSSVNDSVGGSWNLGESLHPRNLQFSSQVVKTFLAERWKDAIAAEHVTLVLTPTSEAEYVGAENGSVVSTAQISDLFKAHEVLGGTEHQLVVNVAQESANPGAAAGKTKIRAMTTEKGVKLKFIPKQRTIT